MNLTNKKVLIVGLGRSGLAASRLLLSKGACLWVTSNVENAGLRSLAENLIQDGAFVELGKHSRNFVKRAELIVISPGIDHQCKVIEWANEYKIPIVSELELAGWYADCPFVGVTGTNGKSTVTSLIEHIFRCNGKSVVACGNIGLPLSEVVLQKKKLDLAVIEVSSFQLEYIDNFLPEIAVWLNFSCDHLDHHQSMEEYFKTKMNIFKNQRPSDWAVVNSLELNRIKSGIKCRIRTYSSNRYVFQENINAAVAVAGIYGINLEDIKSSIKTFKPLPHRLQYISAVGGVHFIDDSKATNIASVRAALARLPGPAVLILGGRDKGDDFTKLKELIIKKVSSIIAIGESRTKIWTQLKDMVPVERIRGFNEAVSRAFEIAAPGGVVLLSPGCSSFDMFRDYRERGDVFQECVFGLNDKKEVCVAEK